MKVLDYLFSFVDLEEWAQNWGRGIRRFLIFFVCTSFVMALARHFINPNILSFPSETGGDWDYKSMIGMGALLIALDAMLIVLVSFRTLQTWQSVLAVSGMVATTHVVYPLATFALTYLFYWLAGRNIIPDALAHGVVTAIYFIALLFVSAHLKEVHGNIRDGKAERFTAAITTLSWSVVAALAIVLFPEVHGVSIDALMVGPAKIAFVARYTTTQFILSFVFIGSLVGILVMASGFAVMAFNRWVNRQEDVAKWVQRIDFAASLLLVTVFIHFTVFAGVYFLYTFWPETVLLQTGTIWGTTGIVTVLYMTTKGAPMEVWRSSFVRAGIEN